MDAEGDVEEEMVKELARRGDISAGKPPTQSGVQKDWHRKVGNESMAVSLKAVTNTVENREIVAVLQQMESPNIVKVFACVEFVCREQMYLALIKEKLDKTLKAEVTYREEQTNPFTCREVQEQITALVLALAMLQDQKIAHCNIQPSTLQVDSKHGFTVKLDDFSNSLINIEDKADSLDAPILYNSYCSPEIRHARTHRSKVFHNPFKSDVFSLGQVLCFLLKSAAGQVINSDQFLTDLCQEMTQAEATRPTFKGLSKWLELRAAYQPPESMIPSDLDYSAATNLEKAMSIGETVAAARPSPSRIENTASVFPGNQKTEGNPSQFLLTSPSIPKGPNYPVTEKSCQCRLF